VFGFVLNHQFVIERINVKTHQVLTGTGQGKNLAGDVASKTFLTRVEAPFVLKDGYREAYGIKWYARYVDNTFMVVNSVSNGGRVLAKLRDLARTVWLIKLEQVHPKRLDILDATAIVSKAGTIRFEPKFKPKGTLRYLSTQSAHPPAVHHWWPRAYANRLCAIRSSEFSFRAALRVFQQRLRADFIDIQFDQLLRKPTSLPARTMPYHPSLRFVGLNLALSNLAQKWQQHLQIAFNTNMTVVIRIAWARSEPNLEAYVRSNYDV